MKRVLPVIIGAFMVFQTGISQEVQLTPTVISSAGNFHKTESMSLSWTLGEVAVTTLSGDNLVLTQGFQQPFGGTVGIEPDPIKWQISAYPNPVRNELRLQFDLPEVTDFSLEVQDVSGRVLFQQEDDEVYPGDILPVEMSDYKVGLYFFRIATMDRKQVRVISIRKE